MQLERERDPDAYEGLSETPLKDMTTSEGSPTDLGSSSALQGSMVEAPGESEWSDSARGWKGGLRPNSAPKVEVERLWASLRTWRNAGRPPRQRTGSRSPGPRIYIRPIMTCSRGPRDRGGRASNSDLAVWRTGMRTCRDHRGLPIRTAGASIGPHRPSQTDRQRCEASGLHSAHSQTGRRLVGQPNTRHWPIQTQHTAEQHWPTHNS